MALIPEGALVNLENQKRAEISALIASVTEGDLMRAPLPVHRFSAVIGNAVYASVCKHRQCVH